MRLNCGVDRIERGWKGLISEQEDSPPPSRRLKPCLTSSIKARLEVRRKVRWVQKRPAKALIDLGQDDPMKPSWIKAVIKMKKIAPENSPSPFSATVVITKAARWAREKGSLAAASIQPPILIRPDDELGVVGHKRHDSDRRGRRDIAVSYCAPPEIKRS